jgi:hypothetical protein
MVRHVRTAQTVVLNREKPAGPTDRSFDVRAEQTVSTKPLQPAWAVESPFSRAAVLPLCQFNLIRASRVPCPFCPRHRPASPQSSLSCAFRSAVLGVGERCARASALRSLAKPYTLARASFMATHGATVSPNSPSASLFRCCCSCRWWLVACGSR